MHNINTNTNNKLLWLYDYIIIIIIIIVFVSYSTSIDPIIVSVTSFYRASICEGALWNIWRVILMTLNQHSLRSWCQLEAHWWFPVWPPLSLTLYLSGYSRHLMRKFCDLDPGLIQVIHGLSSWCQSISHGRLPIRLALTPSSYLSPVSKYLTCNFNDLEPAQFKVPRCQSEAHWWFLIWPPLWPTLYLSRHSIYLMWNFCDLNLGRFKVIQGQRWWCPRVVSYSTFIDPRRGISAFSRYRYLTLKLFFHGGIGEN